MAAMSPSSGADTDSPRLILRSYRASDHDQVDFIFYSTYFALVPEGVKAKLKSPLFWLGWLGIYAYLMMCVPIVLDGMGLPWWVYPVLRGIISLAWIVVAFAGLFVLTDRLDVVDRIEQARQNDLRDPECTYMNIIKEECVVSDDKDKLEDDEGVKKRVTFDKDTKPATELVRRPRDAPTQSHFWVLQMDGQVCGTVGIVQYDETQYDERPRTPPGWKKIGQLLCERYHLRVPQFLQFDPYNPRVALAGPHEPYTASLQRLAVKHEFQNCGLSTLMLNRALAWAHQQGIRHIYAVTNEMQTHAADILKSRHQFVRVKKERKGWLGKYEITWVCPVEEWFAKHADANDKLFQESPATATAAASSSSSSS
ncbi:hypothetical protein BC940DRAFT_309769 [Gongronella butleri]|nr:hypothetical protein BC940DRAFT_309769 [Gongronella butleri]